MGYLPIRLSRTNGTTIVINAATITGLMPAIVGRIECVYVRTVDGNEWIVTETLEQIEAAVEAAKGGALSPVVSAPMVVETKTKGGKK